MRGRRLERKSPSGGLEHKYSGQTADLTLVNGTRIEGYASVFGLRDQGGDVVQSGAYARSLQALAQSGRRVKMLWQHEAREPIGIWDEVKEDATGLYVRGRLLTEISRAREAAALIEAGAIDGLSIGYRTVRASKDRQGHRTLSELELWEVSLVTFPMLPDARVDPAVRSDSDDLAALTADIVAARSRLASI